MAHAKKIRANDVVSGGEGFEKDGGFAPQQIALAAAETAQSIIDWPLSLTITMYSAKTVSSPSA